MLRYTRVLYRGKAVVPGGEMEHEAQEAGSIGVQGAFASNSMHYTSPYTHQRHWLTTPPLSLFLSQTHVHTHTRYLFGKRFLELPLRARSNIF